MRIDLNTSSMPELARSNGAGAAQAGEPVATGQAGAAANADDVASLSTGSDSVQKLKTQLDTVSDLRQPLVDRLRQAVADGSFIVSPQHIAQAMLGSGDEVPGK
jgi:flagellar biosynthesis anti-sigma factor FlgM